MVGVIKHANQNSEYAQNLKDLNEKKQVQKGTMEKFFVSSDACFSSLILAKLILAKWI
jgi:hypothetical protein